MSQTEHADGVTVDDSLIRVDDVLALVKVSRPTWYRLCRRGEAPKQIHLGRTAVWRKSDIAAWIAGLGAR